MEDFAFRPAYGNPDLSLIEFRGDHRSAGFPTVLRILEINLQGFEFFGSQPAPDDFLWECKYDGGTFEISNDLVGLFIMPRSNASAVVEQIAATLAKSGCFTRVSCDEHGA